MVVHSAICLLPVPILHHRRITQCQRVGTEEEKRTPRYSSKKAARILRGQSGEPKGSRTAREAEDSCGKETPARQVRGYIGTSYLRRSNDAALGPIHSPMCIHGST